MTNGYFPFRDWRERETSFPSLDTSKTNDGYSVRICLRETVISGFAETLEEATARARRLCHCAGEFYR